MIGLDYTDVRRAYHGLDYECRKIKIARHVTRE